MISKKFRIVTGYAGFAHWTAGSLKRCLCGTRFNVMEDTGLPEPVEQKEAPMPIGPRELLIILLVVVLLFGAKNQPELAREMGRSMRILKSEVNQMKAENER